MDPEHQPRRDGTHTDGPDYDYLAVQSALSLPRRGPEFVGVLRLAAVETWAYYADKLGLLKDISGKKSS